MKALAIASNTFREAVRQPFYLLVLVIVVALIGLHYFLPFFTLDATGEMQMFKDVCLSYILFGLLVTALLLASKVVDEEIENRTTLTLMSKPVRRYQLILGKFVGVMAAVTLALIIYGVALYVATRLRVPEEMRIDPQTTDEQEFEQLAAALRMHSLSLLPAYALIWLQIAVMTAIGVAASTRVGMVANLVIGIGIYVAGHLTAYLGVARGPLAKGLVVVLPFLENFNLNDLIIYKDLVFSGAAPGPGQVAYSHVWALVGLAGLYALGYVAVALTAALALFRTRELG